MAENMRLLDHSNGSSHSISIFLYLFPDPQFLQGDTRGQDLLYWAVSKSPFALDRHTISSFKAGCILRKIIQNKGSQHLCSQDVYKCKRPVENCLPTSTTINIVNNTVIAIYGIKRVLDRSG